MSRFKSPVVWVALASLIYFIVKTWVGFEIPGWDEFITLLLAALAGFGVVNNPTDKTHF